MEAIGGQQLRGRIADIDEGLSRAEVSARLEVLGDEMLFHRSALTVADWRVCAVFLVHAQHIGELEVPPLVLECAVGPAAADEAAARDATNRRTSAATFGFDPPAPAAPRRVGDRRR